MKLVVDIIDNDNLGNGVAFVSGKKVFIPNCIKGEQVLVDIFKEKSRYSLGKVIKVLKPSCERVEVNCPYFPSCGGCCFLNFDANLEKNIKLNYLKKLFPDTVVKDIIFEDKLFYRNKVVLHVVDGKIGFYKEKSNELLEIDSCLLLDSKINFILTKIKSLSLTSGEVMIRSTLNGQIMVSFTMNVDISSLREYVDSIYIKDKCVYGQPYLKEVINGVVFTIYPKAFFQVNTLQMIRLYDVIAHYVGYGDSLLDLYCGTGTIAIYLKDRFKHILGIEVVDEAISNANLNKKLNNIDNIDFICDDVDNIDVSDYSVIVVDPPRGGLSNNVIDKLVKNKTKKIVYVSCNPNTLKRDVENMSFYYDLKEITPVSMFYRTKHVECVCLLNRR